VRIHVDVVSRTRGLGAVAHQQAPFALALVINRTLEEIQLAERRVLAERFTLRRRQFVERLVKIENRDRPTKAKLRGRLGIQGRAPTS